jgi:hypothetical protein
MRSTKRSGRLSRVRRLLTRPEFPWLYAKASTAVATPLLGVVTVVYTQQAISQRPADSYPFGMAAFGVSIAFAGVCYTVPSSDGGLSTTRYAGEKFLHASLLLLQSLMLIFAKNAAITHSPQWVQPWVGTAKCLGVVAGVVASLVAAAAAWCWYWGFEELNSELWRNWERRIRSRIVAFDSQRGQGHSEHPEDSSP